MEIPRDPRPVELPSRRRTGDAAPPAVRSDATPPAGEAVDSVSLTLSHDQIAGYVAALKDLAPERLHRVEDLRARIADGSYRADPDELAGPLYDLLGG